MRYCSGDDTQYTQQTIHGGKIRRGRAQESDVGKKHSRLSQKFYIPKTIKEWIEKCIGKEIGLNSVRYTPG